MKPKNIPTSLLFLCILQFSYAQITPIETIVDTKKQYIIRVHITKK